MDQAGLTSPHMMHVGQAIAMRLARRTIVE